MKAQIITPNFAAYIGAKAKLIDDLDDMAMECVEVARDMYYDEMKKGLERHRDEGDALDALVKDPIERNGNIVSTTVGTDSNVNLPGYLHANYQEHGVGPERTTERVFVKAKSYHKGHTQVIKTSKGGKPRFIKDPWFRPVVDGMRRKVRNAWLDIINKRLGGGVK